MYNDKIRTMVASVCDVGRVCNRLELSRVQEMFYLDCSVVVTWVYMFVETLAETIYLRLHS